MKVIYYCVVLVSVLFSCSTEPHKEYAHIANRSKKYFEEDKKKDSSNFVFPDSVLHQPLIATYFEIEAGAHSIMFYNDTSKKFGQVIRYFPDSTVLTDKIKRENYNEFSSIQRPEIRYLLDQDRLIYVCWGEESKTIQYSFEHLRTDVMKH